MACLNDETIHAAFLLLITDTDEKSVQQPMIALE